MTAKNVAVLLPDDYRLLSVASVLDVFESANRIYHSQYKEEPFRISVMCSPNQIERDGKVFQGYTVKSIRSNLKADLVLIPSVISPNLRDTIDRNKEFIPWLLRQYQAGGEIASFCTGAFLFAASGLLNGKLATTHVDMCPNLIVAFPSVYVKPGRTLTVDERCYTSGGSNTSFHLLIFLVQKYCGRETAVRVSKHFAIELDRHQQSYFSTFRPDYSHNDDLVKKVQRKIESGFQSINTIEEVTKDLPASRRNIVRRFKQVTGIPPIIYLQNVRIEMAKRQLEQTDLSISEIVMKTGYADPKSFRKVFLKLVGIKPLASRENFNVK
jgi:transcriptional regulator GlxA family with amidase domain